MENRMEHIPGAYKNHIKAQYLLWKSSYSTSCFIRVSNTQPHAFICFLKLHTLSVETLLLVIELLLQTEDVMDKKSEDLLENCLSGVRSNSPSSSSATA